MLREVRLYGHLADKFGKSHFFDVASPAEAVAALRANFRDFNEHVLKHNLPGYKVLVGSRKVGKENLRDRDLSKEPIRIVPVLAGAKSANLGAYAQIVIGAVLVVAGYYTMGASAKLGTAMIAAGIASMIGGVVTLLTPKPKGPNERPENEPSYFFDGAVNTTAQGHPVPILYGRLVIGSAVISSGINATEYAGAATPADPGLQTMPDEQVVYNWTTNQVIP